MSEAVRGKAVDNLRQQILRVIGDDIKQDKILGGGEFLIDASQKAAEIGVAGIFSFQSGKFKQTITTLAEEKETKPAHASEGEIEDGALIGGTPIRAQREFGFHLQRFGRHFEVGANAKPLTPDLISEWVIAGLTALNRPEYNEFIKALAKQHEDIAGEQGRDLPGTKDI
ncbi:hypothetical protein ACFLRC_00885 [Candidatus Altiarchaeota archaeon]